MILDPRLLPWSDVAPGLAVSAIIAICGWCMSRWKPQGANILITIAPIIGWAWMIDNLSGSLPGFPPTDAPLWSLYFAVAGVALAMAAPWWGKRLWLRIAVATVFSVGMVAALWFLLIGALHQSVARELPTGGQLALGLCVAIVFGVTIAMPRRASASVNPAAGYTPWITALVITSICLTLTGTARLGVLAVGLSLATIPAAIAMMFFKQESGYPANALSADSPRHPGSSATPSLPWLPQVFSLPPLIISGPLFANTPWQVMNLILTGALAGMTVIAIMALCAKIFRTKTHHRPHTTNRYYHVGTLIAIAITATATAAPVVFVIRELLEEAAASGFPY